MSIRDLTVRDLHAILECRDLPHEDTNDHTDLVERVLQSMPSPGAAPQPHRRTAAPKTIPYRPRRLPAVVFPETGNPTRQPNGMRGVHGTDNSIVRSFEPVSIEIDTKDPRSGVDWRSAPPSNDADSKEDSLLSSMRRALSALGNLLDVNSEDMNIHSLFSLPEDEQLLKEIQCSLLSGSDLLPSLALLFDHFLCFSFPVGVQHASQSRVTIPLSSIMHICKASEPNSPSAGTADIPSDPDTVVQAFTSENMLHQWTASRDIIQPFLAALLATWASQRPRLQACMICSAVVLADALESHVNACLDKSDHPGSTHGVLGLHFYASDLQTCAQANQPDGMLHWEPGPGPAPPSPPPL